MMTRAEEKEIIKAFAFGFSPAQIAEECGITVDEAKDFAKSHAEEIKAKRSEKHE